MLQAESEKQKYHNVNAKADCLSVSADNTVPIPKLSWTNNKRFWEVMCEKDRRSVRLRNPNLFEYQLCIKPTMRSRLLEWISEVAEMFTFHRETFYLAIDYIDRYLSKDRRVLPNRLQLIGITCLYVAAKIEEIYPPKVEEFAILTDGACLRDEIIDMEVIIVQRLEWMLTPMTVSSWIEMFVQFMYRNPNETEATDSLHPRFNGSSLKRLYQLVDLAMLDSRSLKFSYGVITTSAVYILVDPSVAFSVSGLQFSVIEPCVQWLTVYNSMVETRSTTEISTINLQDLPPESYSASPIKNNPRIHTHAAKIELFTDASNNVAYMEDCKRYADLTTRDLETPPPSAKKVRKPPAARNCLKSAAKSRLFTRQMTRSHASVHRGRKLVTRGCRRTLPIKRTRRGTTTKATARR